MRKQKILLTGATGYVGGKLLKKLEESGHEVHCLVRNPDKLKKAGPNTTVYQGDVMVRSTMLRAFTGVDTAYYLVHSLADKHDFEEHELKSAENFAFMARSCGVKRIVYLGGLGNEEDGLSPHLQSRQDVGLVLRRSGVPTVELRASIVLGAGSLSFEMIRALTEHLPFMVMPKWVSVKAQPIGINDLLRYLMKSLDITLFSSQVFEIGGADQVSYRELMVEYARQRGLKRLMIPVPLLTPWLSSHWLGLITPLYAAVGRKLIESIRNPTVIENPSARERFGIIPCGMKGAISEALEAEQEEFVQAGWLESMLARMGTDEHRVLNDKNRLVDCRRSTVSVSPQSLFQVFSSIGGKNGMFAFNALWHIREWADHLAGGGNIRHRRSEGGLLEVGDEVDFFRVEIVEMNRRLRLKTDMKLPGAAWLEFMAEQKPEGTVFHHAVIYEPKGFAGRVYWYLTYPAHAVVFRGMHKAILSKAMNREAERGLYMTSEARSW